MFRVFKVKGPRGARLLIALAVTALSLGLAPSALAAGTGAISGVVTELSGSQAAIHGIEVCALPVSPESINAESSGCTKTDSSGEYTIAGLVSGEYDVEFFSPSNSKLNFVAQYYDAKSFEDANPVPVIAEQTTSGIDARLEEGGLISGKATRPAGVTPIEGIEVCAFSSDPESFGCATTEANGEYTIAGLAGGAKYVVEFFSPVESHLYYLTQYYNDKTSAQEANQVPVSTGATTSGIDAELEEGGRIQGRVTSASTGAALSSTTVCVFTESSSRGECQPTNSNGEYTTPVLPSGGYKVGFNTSKSYAVQFYNDKPSFGEAERVTVLAGQLTSGIDAMMQLAASAPANTKAPTVSGTAAVGGVLLCSPGLWTGIPAPTLTEQWLRSGSPIAGATTSAYLVQSADAGHNLACRVTAKNTAGQAVATSAAVAIPAVKVSTPPPPPAPVPVVTVTKAKIVVAGHVARGLRLKCSNAACRGTVELTIRVTVRRRRGRHVVARRETLVLASGSFGLAPGASSAVTLRLTAVGRRRLAHVKHHPLTVQLRLSAAGARGTSLLVRVR